MILQRNLRDQFILINVEKYANKLPQFVDRAPMICTRHKAVIADDDVYKFVQMISSQSSQPPIPQGISQRSPLPEQRNFQQKQPTTLDNIAPFTSTLSQEFALLSDNAVDTNISCNQPTNYVFLGDSDNQTIPTPGTDENKPKMASGVLDRLIAARNEDLSQFNTRIPHPSMR